MQEQKSEIESTQNKFGSIGPIIIDPLMKRFQMDALVTLSVTSKALALKTEEQFTKHSPIKKPLSLRFAKEQDTSVWQPAKHSYFLRTQFQQALSDLKKRCCTYGRLYEGLTIEFWGDENGKTHEEGGMPFVIREFPEYSRLHGYIGGTFFEIIIDDKEYNEPDGAKDKARKVAKFAQQLKVGVEQNDPVCLEVAWAIKCYHLNSDLIKSQLKSTCTNAWGKEISWDSQLEPLFNLAIFEKQPHLTYSKDKEKYKKIYADRLINFSKLLYLSGLDEIKDHYGIQISTFFLTKVRDTYKYQLDKFDKLQSGNSEDVRNANKVRYTSEYERYAKLVQKKQSR
jgi:hypothetical protein